MKKITLILNWLIIVCAVISTFVTLSISLFAEPDEPIELGILGGADGPTAVFLSARFDPSLIIIPLLIVTVLLMNILVISKQGKQKDSEA